MRRGRRAVAATAALERLSPREVLARRDEIARVWTWVTPERVDEILPRHVERRGFRFVAATSGGRLAGFTYGYLGEAGQWWHDLVASAMTREQRDRWLAPGHFEYTELHVGPEFRRIGLGGRLHDALLEGLDSRTAVLTTQVDNEPALALYRGRGWQIVVPQLDFGSGRLFAVLGKELTPPAE